MSFELREVTWAEDFREADVLVAASWVLPNMGSRPVPVPLSSNWRLVDGVWRLHLKQRPTAEDGSYISPAGAMSFSDAKTGAPLGTPGATVNALQPTLTTLAGLYEVSEKSLSFERSGDAIQTREVVVRNKAQGSLTVELVGQATGLDVSIDPEKSRRAKSRRSSSPLIRRSVRRPTSGSSNSW